MHLTFKETKDEVYAAQSQIRKVESERPPQQAI